MNVLRLGGCSQEWRQLEPGICYTNVMSEFNEESIENDNKRPSLWKVLKHSKQVAFSRSYDTDVDLKTYEAQVELLGARTNLAKVVADMLSHHVQTPPGLEKQRILDIAAGTGIISRAIRD